MATTKIYSMASNDVVIPVYAAKKSGVSGANKIKEAVIVRGGANVAFGDPDKVKRDPKFVITEVDSNELAVLKANPSFMRKVERGFISIGKEPAELKKDKSAQLTEGEIKKKNPKAKASTGPVDE